MACFNMAYLQGHGAGAPRQGHALSIIITQIGIPLIPVMNQIKEWNMVPNEKILLQC